MKGVGIIGARASIDPATQDAARWFARLRADDVTGADRLAFERWLNEDFEHRSAYERFERFWSRTGQYAGEREIAQTVKRIHQPPVWLRWALAASVGVLLLAAALLLPGFLNANGLHETGIGEQQTLALEDGSRITLNTDTRVQIDFSSERRGVKLERGQAYFRVARDAARPFEVMTQNGVVRAVGTEFDVYQQDDEVIITLVQGKVTVSESNSGGAVHSSMQKALQPGERIALMEGRQTQPQRAPVEHSTAWLAGKLVFDDQSLEYAVAQANRYSTNRIEFGAEQLKALRISGVFRTGETDEFVQAIVGYFPVRAQRDKEGNYLLKPTGTAHQAM
jgi:transmembrane sensor